MTKKQKIFNHLDNYFDEKYASKGLSKTEIARRSIKRAEIDSKPNIMRDYVREWLRKNNKEQDIGSKNTKDKDDIPLEQPPDEALGLEFVQSDEPTYYEDGDYWKVYIPSKGRVLKVDGEVDRKIKRMYSNEIGKGKTRSEIATKLGWNENVLKEYQIARGWVHDSLRYTDEEFLDEDNTTSDLVRDTLSEKKKEYVIERNQKLWKQIKSDAEKWNQFKNRVLNPLKASLEDVEITDQSHIDLPEPEWDYPFCVNFSGADAHLNQANFDGTGMHDNIRVWLNTHKELISHVKSKHGTPELAIAVLGSDLWAIDTFKETTTLGTDQSIDGDFANTVKPVAQSGIKYIECLRKYAPKVKVLVVPGNHDRAMSYLYHWALEWAYEDQDSVEINDHVGPYQYEKYGKNVFGYHHGDGIKGGKTTKPDKLTSKMTHDVPHLLEKGCKKFWFVNHLHHLWEQDQGSIIQQTPTTAKGNHWEENKGFATEVRGQAAWIFGKEAKRLDRSIVSV